jgi:hypothetical protein
MSLVMRVRVLLKLIFGLFRSMTEKGSMRWSVVGQKNQIMFLSINLAIFVRFNRNKTTGR